MVGRAAIRAIVRWERATDTRRISGLHRQSWRRCRVRPEGAADQPPRSYLNETTGGPVERALAAQSGALAAVDRAIASLSPEERSELVEVAQKRLQQVLLVRLMQEHRAGLGSAT